MHKGLGVVSKQILKVSMTHFHRVKMVIAGCEPTEDSKQL